MIPRRRTHCDPLLREEVLHALRRGRVADGPERSAFVAACRDMFAAPQGRPPEVETAMSGRAALLRLLQGLGVPRGATVLLPAYTLGALVPFLRRNGYRVALCDVGRDRPVMSGSSVAAAWTEDVRCVLATHLFGHSAPVEEIATFVRARGGVVLEDCAHAWGVRREHRLVGSFGDGALFSLDALKTVHSFGGGVAVFRSPPTENEDDGDPRPTLERSTEALSRIASGVAEGLLFRGPWLRLPTGLLAFPRTRRIALAADALVRRNPGRHDARFELSNLQCALASRHLASMEARLARRRRVAREVLASLDLEDPCLEESSPSRSNAYFVVVRARGGESAVAIRRQLWRAGIDAGVETEVADVVRTANGEVCPNANDWFRRAIQLPCFEDMADDTLSRLQARLSRFRGLLVL